MITISSGVLVVGSLVLLGGLIFAIGFVVGALFLHVHHIRQRSLAAWVEENVFANNTKYFAKMYTDYERNLLQAQIRFANGGGTGRDPYFETRRPEDYEDDSDFDETQDDELFEEVDVMEEPLANLAEADAKADIQNDVDDDDDDSDDNSKNKKIRLH